MQVKRLIEVHPFHLVLRCGFSSRSNLDLCAYGAAAPTGSLLQIVRHLEIDAEKPHIHGGMATCEAMASVVTYALQKGT